MTSRKCQSLYTDLKDICLSPFSVDVTNIPVLDILRKRGYSAQTENLNSVVLILVRAFLAVVHGVMVRTVCPRIVWQDKKPEEPGRGQACSFMSTNPYPPELYSFPEGGVLHESITLH